MVNASLYMSHTLQGTLDSVRGLMSTSDSKLICGPGLDALTDLLCAGIPIFVIQRLQMNIRTKFALCFLMGLGVL